MQTRRRVIWSWRERISSPSWLSRARWGSLSRLGGGGELAGGAGGSGDGPATAGSTEADGAGGGGTRAGGSSSMWGRCLPQCCCRLLECPRLLQSRRLRCLLQCCRLWRGRRRRRRRRLLRCCKFPHSLSKLPHFALLSQLGLLVLSRQDHLTAAVFDGRQQHRQLTLRSTTDNGLVGRRMLSAIVKQR